jgi:hypothetical protein
VATLVNGTTFDLGSGNLCVACHQARRNAATYITNPFTMNTHFGPHYGVQGDMLIGTNGYEFAGYTYERSSHREATTANGGDGCLECHYKATSQYVVGGHTFNMRGMVRGEEVLNVGACAPCHGAVDDFSDIGPGYSVQDSVDTLLEELKTHLIAAGLVDATTGDPKAVKTSRDSAGAVWNYAAVEEDRSRGVHNPKYIMGLLESSIQFIQGPVPQVAHWKNTRY